MRKVIIVLLIAVIHLGLAVGLALKTFEISGFMFGLYPQPTDGPVHSALTAAHSVMMFPLGLVAESLGPSVRFLAWPLVVVNSLLWAVVIYVPVVRWFTRGRRKITDRKVGV